MKERIRCIMEYVQLTQQDFAAKLNISPASLSGIFTGRTNPTNNHVMGYELKQLPIVHASAKDREYITQLVEEIVRCAKNNEDYVQLMDAVNKKIYSLYGLTKAEISLVEG